MDSIRSRGQRYAFFSHLCRSSIAQDPLKVVSFVFKQTRLRQCLPISPNDAIVAPFFFSFFFLLLIGRSREERRYFRP